jgi:hypothetical protein
MYHVSFQVIDYKDKALDKPDSDVDNPVPDELQGINTCPSVIFIRLPQL